MKARRAVDNLHTGDLRVLRLQLVNSVDLPVGGPHGEEGSLVLNSLSKIAFQA